MAHCLLALHQCKTNGLALYPGTSDGQARCPLTPNTPLAHPLTACQVRPTHFLGGRDRAQVHSGAVMTEVLLYGTKGKLCEFAAGPLAVPVVNSHNLFPPKESSRQTQRRMDDPKLQLN
ncbi:hypothetical protein NQZ68_001104 [Dissostichus eleginoides]|nr:hypothetical protein NQZ68_001104 [Dissostichus eleginoides]